ncbi:hypothetical protein ACFPTX_18790 [Pseudomonas sp. GCM10022188]|uniref:hypothetical protein n=1 Tax=Pseudomonas TaxID=286 RepID=UPI001E36BBC4|nr:hypothetical protein [Pseudomonas oryzagri]MCC6075854.1 hypothetical protein [Pseudomonas oryzagri]
MKLEVSLMEHLFADAVSEVSIAGGVVRIVFGVQRKASKDAKPELQQTFSLNIPLEGFANSMPSLQGLIDKLVKDGVLKTRDAKQLGSPNFN